MKDFYFPVFGLFLLYACGNNTPPGEENCCYRQIDEEDGWTLVWEDNFNSDLSMWNLWVSGAYNNELQFYSDENVFLRDGFLHIHQQRKAISGPTDPFNNTVKSFDFVSGRIESVNEFGPEAMPSNDTVKFAARILLPAGEGLWPAFWSFNDPWPTVGELDILEYRGGEANVYQTNFHYGADPGLLLTTMNEARFVLSENLSECFHIYEVEWSETQFVMKLDGQVMKIYDSNSFDHIEAIFGNKHRLVLNLAVGGDFFQNLMPPSIPDESVMIVDWVKVWAR